MISHAPQSLGPIRQLIIQPTSFCNLDCRYCYLSTADRSQKNMISIETTWRAFEFALESGLCHTMVEIRWHAGEPLARGLDFYHQAHAIAESVFGPGNFRFSIQTNGTLINDAWCDFFLKHDVEVGVSLDGPNLIHDRNRVNRRGHGTFDHVMHGIDRLKSRGIAFDLISVLTDDALMDPDGTYQFFSHVRCRELGFNTDDFAAGSPEFIHLYRRFMVRMNQLSHAAGGMKIRELDQMRQAILSPVLPVGNVLTCPLAILSVAVNGDLATYSPELLTFKRDGARPFLLGNVHRDTWESVTSSQPFATLAAAVNSGVAQCRSSCPYFSICGGGCPAAKVIHNGTFDSTQTPYCLTRVQTVADVVLSHMESTPRI